MFGYVTVDAETLSPEERARFRRIYCGVCSCLPGMRGRFTLSYDSAFLALVLNALYEPEETLEKAHCPVHPFSKHEKECSEITAYAADINIILFYYSLLDGWTDDKSAVKKVISDTLKHSFEAAVQRQPGKAVAIEQALKQLSGLEKARTADIDAAAGCFGHLLGEVFAYRDDMWAGTLRAMGDALGRFIYICDAWDDADKDKKNGAFNPLLPLRDEPDYEERVFEMLKLEMAACADAFERLPIVKDINIIRNVIYSGVWTKYSAKRKQDKGGDGVQ